MTYKIYFSVVLMIFGLIALCVYAQYIGTLIFGLLATPVGVCLFLYGLSKTEEKIKELEERIKELEKK